MERISKFGLVELPNCIEHILLVFVFYDSLRSLDICVTDCTGTPHMIFQILPGGRLRKTRDHNSEFRSLRRPTGILLPSRPPLASEFYTKPCTSKLIPITRINRIFSISQRIILQECVGSSIRRPAIFNVDITYSTELAEDSFQLRLSDILGKVSNVNATAAGFRHISRPLGNQES